MQIQIACGYWRHYSQVSSETEDSTFMSIYSSLPLNNFYIPVASFKQNRQRGTCLRDTKFLQVGSTYKWVKERTISLHKEELHPAFINHQKIYAEKKKKRQNLIN